jgi:aquaporin Z
LVYTVGKISGCHVNPAVTVGMLVAGKIKGKDALAYIISQCIGAIVAAAVLLAIARGRGGYVLAVHGLGQNGYGIASPAGYSLLACLIAEIVLTALFLLVIFGSTSKDAPQKFAGLSIGFALAFVHIVGIPITGTSVNPARSLGPALIAGGQALSQVWLFWVAPLFGAIVAALIWRFGFERE